MLMADMSHIAGLIVSGVAKNPFDYDFHVITTTTHKTLRGPRGGLILSRGIVGNPLKKPEKTLENLTYVDRSSGIPWHARRTAHAHYRCKSRSVW